MHMNGIRLAISCSMSQLQDTFLLSILGLNCASSAAQTFVKGGIPWSSILASISFR